METAEKSVSPEGLVEASELATDHRGDELEQKSQGDRENSSAGVEAKPVQAEITPSKPPVIVHAPKLQALENLKGEELSAAFAVLSVELAYGLHALSRLGTMLPGSHGETDRSKQRIYDWNIGSLLSLVMSPESLRLGTVDLHHVFGQRADGVPRELLQVMRRPMLTLAVDHLRRDIGVIKRIEGDIQASRSLIDSLVAEFRLREQLSLPIEKEEQKQKSVLKEDKNSMIVLRSIGDAQSSEGQDAINRFGKLLLPLPLKGTNLDADKIWDELQEEFPWMMLANLHIAQSVALSNLGDRAFRAPPVLLVGPPGIGKTRWGRRVSEIAGLGFSWLSFSGLNSAMSVIGNERGYKGARPGFAASAISTENTANPLLMLDEVDKSTQGGQNGDPIAALLPLMEASTAKRFPDNYLLGEMDLSAVSWVLTANDQRYLPEPLLNRLLVINVEAPDEGQLDRIIQRMLVEFAEEYQLPVTLMPSIRDAMPKLHELYINARSLRDLNTAVKAEVAKRLWYPAGFENVLDKVTKGFQFGFSGR